jgi:hypothetical protein
MMPRTLSLMRLFPFSAQQPGVGYVAVQPVSWGEATVLERRFVPGIEPQEATEIAADLLHEDYAYSFEAYWDLWSPGEVGEDWKVLPQPMKFIAHGPGFEDGAYRDDGHVQIDFGLDTPFLYEDVRLTPFSEHRVRANVQKLVEFTALVEKNAGISGRVLWSESEENLAQKLISRLQKVQ